MSTIHDLPNELLAHIVRFTNIASVPSLALVSRNFYQHANPRLYQDVQFVEASIHVLGQQWQTVPEPNPDAVTKHYVDNSVKERLLESTQIISLSRFLRSLAASHFLRFQVHSLSVQWSHETSLTTRIDGDVRALLYLLSPSLKRLYISAPEPWYGVPPLPHLVELDLNFQYIPSARENAKVRCKLEYLTYLRQLPELRRLSVWNVGRVMRENLQQLAERAPNLRSLRLDINDAPTRAVGSIEENMPNCLVTGLAKLHDQLEELFIADKVSSAGELYSRCDYREFTALKRLAFSYDWRARNRTMWSPYTKARMPPIPLHAMIPASTEELLLDFGPICFAGDEDANERHASKLIDWTVDTMSNQNSQFPALKKVVIWSAETEHPEKWGSVDWVRKYCQRIRAPLDLAKITLEIRDGVPNQTPFIGYW